MSDLTNQRLAKVMRERKLSRSTASMLCMVRDSSLDRWLSPQLTPDGKPNPQYRRMPEHRLGLLESALTNPRPLAEVLAETTPEAQREMHERFMRGLAKLKQSTK